MGIFYGIILAMALYNLLLYITIKDKTYPISRYLYMYLKSQPTGEAKAFIDWILSPEGQKMVEEVGYYPLK